MMTVLTGLKVAQIGDGLAAAVCGRLFADVGAAVACLGPATDTPLAQHLNGDKAVVAEFPEDAAMFIIEGAPAALKAQGWDAASLRPRFPDAALVYVSPYGQTGPDADIPATDLTLFCASAIARCLTGQSDDLSESPLRPVGEQSVFIGGLAAACAGMHAILKGGPTVVDVSVQEALATLSMTELTKAGLGGGGWDRKRLTDGNGATVCILPARDGYTAISPREDHQWAAWLGAMGSPDWGVDPRFATKPDRVRNWDALHALMSRWSCNFDKQSIADLAQTFHVPSFPLKEPGEQLGSVQLEHRHSFRINNIQQTPTKTIANPFGLSVSQGNSPASAPCERGLPLKGVRVLDFSWVIAGPTTTRYLAAMGAEVIKVEAPGRGDPGRGSELHMTLGQAKQGIVLDLKQNNARAIARELTAESDILIENFATGVMDRIGLGAKDLQTANPDLIYISASGMGRSGPKSKAVAYGTLLQCYSGFAGLNRHPEIAPRVGMAWLDPMCGLKLAFIAAASLWHRNNTGGGTRVDFSMVEAMLWTMADPLIAAQSGTPPQPRGNHSAQFAPHGIYRCAGEDDWIGIAVENDAQWQALCTTVPDLGPLSALTEPERRGRRDDIDELLSIFISKQLPSDGARIFTAAGIPAAAVMTTAKLVTDPHLWARGFWDRHESGVLPGLPWQSDFRRKIGPAPALGEHTDHVLERVLGLNAPEIAALRDAGALG
jgi:crotonobetainyl-CoA:carnitine CoA-transferase CaiB-like acyl-CoA transferase